MHLIVVESAGKQSLFSDLLRKSAPEGDWRVLSCGGHYCNLPKSSLGIDPKQNFQMAWKLRDPVNYGKLAKKIEDAQIVYAGTDLSPEGEALAHQISLTAARLGRVFRRLRFESLDIDTFSRALLSPADLQPLSVDSYWAREGLSRFVRFVLSPILESQMGPELSVHFLALPLLSELARTERKIRRFSPEKRWIVRALLSDGSIAESGPLSQRDADSRAGRAQAAVPVFSSAKEADSPLPPFTLSTLIQFLNRRYGYDTMMCVKSCETLFSTGLITYPFTDSTYLPASFVAEVRAYIQEKFSAALLSAAASSTERNSIGLSAIRPTILARLPSQLDLPNDLRTIYSAIWFRAIGSQGKVALVSRQECRYLLDDVEVFKATGTVLEDPGWHQLSGRLFEPVVRPLVPDVSVIEASSIPVSTVPPSRHTHGTLVRWLDAHFLGGPWTYRPSFDFLNSNSYVEMVNGGLLRITPKGEAVLTFIRRTVPDLVDPDFGAEIEEEISAVAAGSLPLNQFFSSYWTWVNGAAVSMQKKVLRPSFVSPDTGSRLQVLVDKSTGRPYVSAPGEEWTSFVEFDSRGKIVLTKEV